MSMTDVSATDFAPDEPPRPDRAAARMLVMIVACTMFMAQLDSTIIATALPQMARSFGTEATSLSLGISIYLLVQAVLLPASNWVSDRLGARRVFAGAVLLFTLASVLCGLSASLPQFVVARVVQGAAAALMTPVGRVVLIRSTAKGDLVRVLTMASAPMLLAPTLGPPVGGFIVSYLSWPFVFYINLPFGLLCGALILRHVPDLRDAVRRPFDWAGFGLVGCALTGLIYGLDRITAPGSAHLAAGLCVVGGIVAGGVAVGHARRAAHPLLSLAALRSHVFRVVALEGGMCARVPMRAIPFIMPLVLQMGMGMSAFVSGLLLMASSGADLLSKPLVAPALRRMGFRDAMAAAQLVSSALIAGLGLAVFMLRGAWLYGGLFALLALLGAARSILFSGMSAVIYADIAEAETGQATVLWNVVQQVSNALAVSCTVILLNALAWTHGSYGTPPSLRDYEMVLVVMAGLGVPALVSFRRLAPDTGARLSGHRLRR
jgi:MFS family permease